MSVCASIVPGKEYNGVKKRGVTTPSMWGLDPGGPFWQTRALPGRDSPVCIPT